MNVYGMVLGFWGMALLAGCSSAPADKEFHSLPNTSFALNVAKAAGLDAKLQDLEVPADTVHNITDSSAYGLAMTLSGYNAPVSGLSNVGGAGLGLAAWVFAPTAASSKSHVIAWMPANLASTPDEAGNKLSKILQEAEQKAATEMGYETKIWDAPETGPYRGNRYVKLFKEGDAYCAPKGQQICALIASFHGTPEKVIAPDFVSQKGESWFLDPTATRYPEIGWNKDYVGIKELEMLQAVSKHLPDWIYLYFAPKKVRLEQDKFLAPPIIMNQGKIHYFIKEKA